MNTYKEIGISIGMYTFYIQDILVFCREKEREGRNKTVAKKHSANIIASIIVIICHFKSFQCVDRLSVINI